MLESLISTIWSACKAGWYPPPHLSVLDVKVTGTPDVLVPASRELAPEGFPETCSWTGFRRLLVVKSIRTPGAPKVSGCEVQNKRFLVVKSGLLE